MERDGLKVKGLVTERDFVHRRAKGHRSGDDIFRKVLVLSRPRDHGLSIRHNGGASEIALAGEIGCDYLQLVAEISSTYERSLSRERLG